MKAANPLAFRPGPVVVICSVIYIALSAIFLYVGCTVPAAPKSDVPRKGLNLSEAYADLQELTNGFHPYNSKRNDEIRSWLLSRVGGILTENGAKYTTVHSPDEGPPGTEADAGSADAVIFNDLLSNVSFASSKLGAPALSTYFEGTNVIVYLRGREDAGGAWWDTEGDYVGQKGVLVNAHYDSVSTGFGATDDGVGVVTVLQLLKYFSTEGQKPKHGIVFLLNNGEEDFLNGARAFAKHPTSRFADRFLNLEGAGAGGRAALFRSTDTEVTRFYERAKHPFASSTSDDGFKAGLVKSGTDYQVFYGDLGMRGLDVAFLEPRSKYHTNEDDVRHTSRASMWHMMSAAVPTMEGLVDSELDESLKTDAVWFDLFGLEFAVMELHTLFALQVTLLVVAPISIIVILVALQRKDKLYLFSRYKYVNDSKVKVGGLKGLFRAPIIFVISSACSIAVAFLIMKFNPFVLTSSPWPVWACFMALWIFATWFQSRFADYVRPSALHKVYTLTWLYLASWVLAVISATYENRGFSSLYPILFINLGFWLANILALCELFVLTRRASYATEQLGQLEADENEASEENGEGEEEPNERTSLLRQHETSFRPRSRRTEDTSTTVVEEKPPSVYGYEQYWSGKLPSTLWVLEFLLVSVPTIIFIGPVISLMTFGLNQTLSDGGATGLYIPMAILAIIYVMPLQPFLHRFSYHIPLFLLLVFAGTLIYSLVTFPFSPNNRLKFYFVQNIDLDSGINKVVLIGADLKSLEHTVRALPSAPSGPLDFAPSSREGLDEVSWSGLPPTVVQPANSHPNLPPELAYEHWLSINVTRPKTSKGGEATLTVRGRNTRNCKLMFDSPVTNFYVSGSTEDNSPFKGVPEDGTNEIRLWHREWDTPWSVNVTWDGKKGLDGRAICMWNRDETQPDGGIPALKEFWDYAPAWAAVTKNGDGLIEGSKRFMI